MKPAVLIIFGATGDLAQRKLLPSMFALYQKKLLPPKFRIIAYSRRNWKTSDYHELVRAALKKKKIEYTDQSLVKVKNNAAAMPRQSARELDDFISNVHYQRGYFNTPQGYRDLKKNLVDIDTAEFKHCSNKLFYLAVPPAHYEEILKNIAYFGLTMACSDGEGWARVLIEKPFGKDTKTAQELDHLLEKLFKEEQVFRIDHYLAKEILQNITMFRFSNTLFEPIWNNKYIDKVEIKLLEILGIEGRGAFYDNIGALRDVGQNHMLRMLAVIAMENPKLPNTENIWLERTKILKALYPINRRNVEKCTVRGQYYDYGKEENVKPGSKTETYFKIKTFINNKRWQGVPFYLESGKAMRRSEAEIIVYLKKPSLLLCPIDQKCDYQNLITFNIQPREGISIRFWAKKPGLSSHLEPKNLSFSYKNTGDAGKIADAYERVLFDCIRGDQTFFTGTEEVKASWKFITPIINSWSKTPLHIYKKGSPGINKLYMEVP